MVLIASSSKWPRILSPTFLPPSNVGEIIPSSASNWSKETFILIKKWLNNMDSYSPFYSFDTNLPLYRYIPQKLWNIFIAVMIFGATYDVGKYMLSRVRFLFKFLGGDKVFKKAFSLGLNGRQKSRQKSKKGQTGNDENGETESGYENDEVASIKSTPAVQLRDMLTFVVCVTGGPCSGRSTTIQYLVNSLSNTGYNVYVVPEICSLLLNAKCSYPGKENLRFDFETVKESISQQYVQSKASSDNILNGLTRDIQKIHHQPLPSDLVSEDENRLLAYENSVLRLQLQFEEAILDIAMKSLPQSLPKILSKAPTEDSKDIYSVDDIEKYKYNHNRKINIILCNQGVIDISVFLSPKDWRSLVVSSGLNSNMLFSRYDLVLQLVTQPDIEKDYYSFDANIVENVRKQDDMIRNAWNAHPFFCVIGNKKKTAISEGQMEYRNDHRKHKATSRLTASHSSISETSLELDEHMVVNDSDLEKNDDKKKIIELSLDDQLNTEDTLGTVEDLKYQDVNQSREEETLRQEADRLITSILQYNIKGKTPISGVRVVEATSLSEARILAEKCINSYVHLEEKYI